MERAHTITHLLLADVAGGAGRAAIRLVRGLREAGAPVELAVPAPAADRVAGSRPVPPSRARHWWVREQIDRLPTRALPPAERYGLTLLMVPGGAGRAVARLRSSLLHIHYLCPGSLRLEALARLRCPVVWTLHDQWLMTGGHHYHNDRADPRRGLYRRQVERKRALIRRIAPTIVAPSRWIAGEAHRSPVLADCRIEVIPNGLDLEAWPRQDRGACRRELGIDPDDFCIAVGALGLNSEPRKGWRPFCTAMEHLARSMDVGRIVLIAFGVDEPVPAPVAGCRMRALPRLTDRRDIQRIYGAADVHVCPSLQDNLPNTVVEACASGTPTVAFGIGGLPDLIDHRKTGYLAEDPADLAGGIAWVAEDASRRARLADAAREKARMFELAAVAARHQRLYDELLAMTPQGAPVPTAGVSLT